MSKSWRDRIRPIVHQVLVETKGQEEKAVRKALREANPWGTSSSHIYKIWRDEIKVQTKQRSFGRRPDKLNTDQTSLF